MTIKEDRYMDELLKERFELAAGRIAEIAVEPCVQEPFGGYFQKTAAFLQEMLNLYHEISQGRYREYSLDVLRQKNCDMYRDILPENYAHPPVSCLASIQVLRPPACPWS